MLHEVFGGSGLSHDLCDEDEDDPLFVCGCECDPLEEEEEGREKIKRIRILRKRSNSFIAEKLVFVFEVG